MRYLLDTHAILWYAQGSKELSIKAIDIMDSEECFYAMASFWEIAIKQKLNKIDKTVSIMELEDLCKMAGFQVLPINSTYIDKTKNLPFIHRDPFDRLLIACAQCENLSIITHDSIIPQYDVKTVW